MKAVLDWVASAFGARHYGCKLYYIGEDGAYHFLVYYRSGQAFIYRRPVHHASDEELNDPCQPKFFTKLVGTYDVLKAWIPVGHEWNGQGFGEEKVSDDFGGTLLFQLQNGKMLYVGSWITQFELEKGDAIEEYYSPEADGWYYPTAIGTHNVYFFPSLLVVPINTCKSIVASKVNKINGNVFLENAVGVCKKLKAVAKKAKKQKVIAKWFE